MSEGNLPSEEEIKRGEQALDILTQLSDVLLENLNINRENTDAIKDSVTAAKDLAAPYQLTNEAAKEINKANRDITQLASKIAKDEENILNRKRSSKDIAKDIAKSSQAEKSLLVEIAKTGELRNQRDKDGNKIHNESTRILDDIIAGMRAQIDQARDIDKALQKELDSALKIENAFGLSGKALEGVNKLLGGALPDLGKIREGAADQLQKLEKEGKLREGLAGKMQGFGALVKSTGGILKANMLDPLTLLKAGFDFDKEATALQKNLGVSGAEAFKLNVTLSMAATNTGNLAIQGKDTAKAFGVLNDQLGVASTSIVGMVGEAAKFQKLLGLSEEAIGRAGKASLITGKSMEDIKLDIIDQTTQVRTQTGIALNYNSILEKTLNVSGQIAAQLGNNPKAIAAAVAQANALGMELEQVAKVGESLLGFEQSIAAELEAELLTGKELNLERARLLALTGDYEELSREIAEQAGTFSEFSKMNVIQQQKLAEAFGMSADELSNMLIDQEALGKTAEELRAEGKEDIAQRLEARDAQQQFTDAVEKMKGIFVDLVGGPVGALLNMLTLALEPINLAITGISKLFGLLTGSKEELSAMEIIFGSIAVGIGSVIAAQKISAALAKRKSIFEGLSLKSITLQGVKERGMQAIKTASAVLSGTKAIAEISAASAITLGLGIAAIIAAIAAGVMAMKSAKADDAIFPGYGKRALLEEGSITLFNDKDTILAGTKLNKTDDMISRPEGTVQAAAVAPPQPVILKNEVVYDSHQSANYYNGPRSTEKSETGIFT